MPQSPANAYLWKCWKYIAQYPRPDLLIVNGDLLDGEAPLDRGRTVKSPDLEIQMAAACEILRPVVAKTTWWLVKGTAYHETVTDAIGAVLGAKEWDGGGRSGQILDLRIRGFNINCSHHPEGGTGAIYKGTIMDRTILWATVGTVVSGLPRYDVIIRSHWHFFGNFQANGKTVTHVPCFQLQTPYAAKQAFFRFQPQIGFVDFLFDENEDYPTVVPVLFPLPERRLVDAG